MLLSNQNFLRYTRVIVNSIIAVILFSRWTFPRYFDTLVTSSHGILYLLKQLKAFLFFFFFDIKIFSVTRARHAFPLRGTRPILLIFPDKRHIWFRINLKRVNQRWDHFSPRRWKYLRHGSKFLCGEILGCNIAAGMGGKEGNGNWTPGGPTRAYDNARFV